MDKPVLRRERHESSDIVELFLVPPPDSCTTRQLQAY
jgi:hypothetical protein